MSDSNKSETTKPASRGENVLRIIPLGGLGEIGKNTMVLACGNDMILIDAGLAFPSEDQIGVDLVLPDITFLKENADKIRGLVVTHGHEDHIGGIPFILKELSIPVIYGPALAVGLLEGKLKEVGVSDRTEMRVVRPRQQIRIGCFTVDFIRCTHSIADSFSVIINTPVGRVVHTGDFKFDFTPVDGELFDIASLTAAGDEGVLLLMSDSTNTEREGYTPSERTVWLKLNEVFSNAPKRIIITTFASNVHRMRQVMNCAIKYDRKVAILGRSMLNLAGIARELGYMTFPDGLLIPIDQVKNHQPNKVVIMTTGSQGEPLSALSRIANDEHKQIKITKGDTVIISATPIPGNERLVANTINSLFMRGADVVYGREAGVHVSGHACREEQKLMINICRPKFFMPIHGEYRMLVKHGELATMCGVEPENVFLLENGEVLEMTRDKGQKNGRVKSGVILVDSSRNWNINEEIVEERRHIAADGLVTINVTVGEKGAVLTNPEISMRGIILPRGVTPEQFVSTIQEQIRTILSQHTAANNLKNQDRRSYMIGALNGFFDSKLKASPLVQVILHDVQNPLSFKPAPAKTSKSAKNSGADASE